MDRSDSSPDVLGSPPAVHEPAALLSDGTARRVANQVGRALRGTFGARTGLQMIVSTAARQLLSAGASQDDVAHAFEACVMDHRDRVECDAHSTPGSENSSGKLLVFVRDCVAAVATERSALPAR